MNTILCISGDLGYLNFVAISPLINTTAIFTDHNSNKIIDLAQLRKIPLFIGNPRSEKGKKFIKKLKKCNILFSINYLYIIEKNLFNFPELISLNIHGSLLPRYRGRCPHIWSIINGEDHVGITIHQIDEGCDTGDILIQEKIELTSSTTGAEVLDIYRERYPKLIKEALSLVQEKNFKLIPQNHSLQTYYGKRIPEDGLIDWRLPSGDLLNWIRALTAPYPGAFAKLNGNNVQIWKAKFLEITPSKNLSNGTIYKIEKDQLFVKIEDGTLIITDYTNHKNIAIKTGQEFTGINNE